MPERRPEGLGVYCDILAADMLPSAFQIEVGGALIRSRGRYGAAEAQSATPVDGRMRERVHASTCLAAVTSGSFEFRTPAGETVATAGSMIFGEAGESFSFRYLGGEVARRAVIALSDDLLAEVADYCGAGSRRFPVAAIPPRRSTTAL